MQEQKETLEKIGEHNYRLGKQTIYGDFTGMSDEEIIDFFYSIPF